jgi:hypothetical protein
MIVSYFGREHLWQGDDLILGAMERVIRERLSAGLTMYFSSTSAAESGREHGTIVLTPQTSVLCTYSDLGADPNTNPQLIETIALLRRHVDVHGGICLDENDLPVEPV